MRRDTLGWAGWSPLSLFAINRRRTAANVSKAFYTLTQPELASRSRGTSHYLIWLFPGVLLISAAVIFLRHNARGVVNDRQAMEITSAGKAPGILPSGSFVEQSTSTLAAALSLDSTGFVLQVAAMKHEDNADALAESLRQRNFTTFVFKRGDDPFYRVAIGVYGDADSAIRVKHDLERQGFKAILRRWIPE
jgi:hypothetical protein